MLFEINFDQVTFRCRDDHGVLEIRPAEPGRSIVREPVAFSSKAQEARIEFAVVIGVVDNDNSVFPGRQIGEFRYELTLFIALARLLPLRLFHEGFCRIEQCDFNRAGWG